jgi:hypothetical protein
LFNNFDSFAEAKETAARECEIVSVIVDVEAFIVE